MDIKNAVNLYFSTKVTVIGEIALDLSMASNESSVEDAFTTIRIRRFDHDRLSNMRRPKESWWEVVRRLLDAHDLEKGE